MNVNRNLLVSFSNGVNWNGVMTLEFVQRRADEEYPDSNIEILVSELGTGQLRERGDVQGTLRICGGLVPESTWI